MLNQNFHEVLNNLYKYLSFFSDLAQRKYDYMSDLSTEMTEIQQTIDQLECLQIKEFNENIKQQITVLTIESDKIRDSILKSRVEIQKIMQSYNACLTTINSTQDLFSEMNIEIASSSPNIEKFDQIYHTELW